MKTRLVAILLATAPIACSGSLQDHASAARDAIANEDFRRARLELLEALSQRQADTNLRYLLALVQLRLGDGYGAENTAVQLSQRGISRSQIVRLRAEAALLRGQVREAISMLGNDSSPDAWRIRAAAKRAMHDEEGALSALQAGAAAGTDPHLLADYIRSLLDLNAVAEADRQLTRLSGLQPDGLRTLMLATDLAVKRRDIEHAKVTLQQANRLYPQAPAPWIARAKLLEMEGDLAGAMDAAARGRALAPDNPELQELEIEFSAVKGDWAKVRSTLAASEGTLDPNSASGLSYAEALLRLGQPEQARSWFQRALVRSPNNHFSRLMLAEAELACGDAQSALATVQPLVETPLAGQRELDLAARAAKAAGHETAPLLRRLAMLQNNQDLALARAGQSALSSRDWHGAIEAYRALAAKGNDAEVLKRLAYALGQAGQVDEAIAAADRARALSPNDPDMIYIAGYVRAAGKRDVAAGLQLIQQASEAAPGDANISRSLAAFRSGIAH